MRDLSMSEEQRRVEGGTTGDFAAERCLDQQMDARLDATLARAPEVQLAENFAARVAAELTVAHEGGKAPVQFGQAVLVWCGALLAVVLLLLIIAGTGHQHRWLLSFLSLELALLALGAGPWRRVLRWPA